MSRKEKAAEEVKEGFIITLSHLCSVSRDGQDSHSPATWGFRHTSLGGAAGLLLGVVGAGH